MRKGMKGKKRYKEIKEREKNTAKNTKARHGN